jgi:hypothetical protein
VRGRCGPSRFSFLRSLEFILRLIYISSNYCSSLEKAIAMPTLPVTLFMVKLLSIHLKMQLEKENPCEPCDQSFSQGSIHRSRLRAQGGQWAGDAHDGAPQPLTLTPATAAAHGGAGQCPPDTTTHVVAAGAQENCIGKRQKCVPSTLDRAVAYQCHCRPLVCHPVQGGACRGRCRSSCPGVAGRY